MSGDFFSVGYAKARKLSAVIELQLDAQKPESPEARQALTGNLNSLFSEVAALERAVDSPSVVYDPANRVLWRKRLMQLQQDCSQLRKTVELHLRRTYERTKVEQDRSELLGVVSTKSFAQLPIRAQ